MADATVTFNLFDALGVTFDYRRTKVWITFNTTEGWVVDENGDIRMDAGAATIDSEGAVTISGIPVPSGATNPIDWQVKIHYSVPPVLSGVRGTGRKTGDFGWMTILADATLDQLISEQYVPPTWLSDALASLQALVDEAEAAAATAGTLTTLRTLVSPTDPSGTLPAGDEYVWFQTDGDGNLLDILSGVA